MSTFLQLPLFSELESANRILIAGCGGGYDIFGGLPIYFGLRYAGKEVYLANLSFSYLDLLPGERLSPAVVEVTAALPRISEYFPELLLAQWFRHQGEDVSVYCLERTGVRPLVAAYKALATHLALDTIVLVDGGMDSLMRGDEAGIGTPHEDIASVIAVDELEMSRKLLVCVGFGVDFFHGVCHAHFLEAVAELTRARAYLGMFSLVAEMPEVQRFREAVEAVHAGMVEHPSIVNSSILAALNGAYGDHHSNERTAGSQLWINPLMPVYWGFRLTAVAQRVLYREAIRCTESYRDIKDLVTDFRARCARIRPWKNMPV